MAVDRVYAVRAMGSVGILRPQPAWRQRAVVAALVLTGAAWTVLALGGWIWGVALPVPPVAFFPLVFGLPFAAFAALLFAAQPPGAAARWLVGWMLLVTGAIVAAMMTAFFPAALLAFPAVLASAAFFGRRPALAMAIVFFISGTYGSLIAFWRVPVEMIIGAVMAGLWVATIFGWLFLGRRLSATLPVGVALLAGYFGITFTQMLLSSDSGLAFSAFGESGWFLLALPLVAYAGWSAHMHRRLAQAIVLIALAVGAYSTYRWFAGAAGDELAAFGANSYNYVGGELRLLGPFPTGQDLGGWTAVLVPFCLALALTFAGVWRIAGFAAAGLCLVALLGSELRIALLAVGAGAGLTILLYQLSRGFPGIRAGTAALLVALAVGGGAGAFALTGGSSDPVSHGYDALLNPSRDDPSVDERLYKWEQAFKDLEGRPFGYGVGTATAGQGTRFRENVGAYNVDSAYLKVALEQGLLVMGVFILALLAMLVYLGTRAVATTSRMRAGIAIGACGSLASMLVLFSAANFADGPRSLAPWVIAGLGLAQFTMRRPDDASGLS